jgi:hypothetical protein
LIYDSAPAEIRFARIAPHLTRLRAIHLYKFFISAAAKTARSFMRLAPNQGATIT